MRNLLGPFLEVARIQSEINHLFESLRDLEHPSRTGGGWIPNVDILETAEELVVKAELPGVEPDDLRVTVGGGELAFEGRRRDPSHADGDVVHLEERQHGEFRRTVVLGVPVNTRNAEAVLVDGLLRVRFPKVPNRRGERVAVEVTTP